MTAFTLRIADPGDEAAVTVLLRQSYGQLMPVAYGEALTAELMPIIARANPRLLASGTYYLAFTPDGELIGVGGWTCERPGVGEVEADIGHIRHFATHPAWTGKGVGRALVDRSVSEARSQGLSRFECYSSLNAVDFYRRLGFLVVRAIDIPMGGDLVAPAVLMERVL